MWLFMVPMRDYAKRCGFDHNCWPVASSVLFNTFSRVVFVTGIVLVILPTFVNRFSMIKYILSSEIFIVCARLTYSVYMIHIFVLLWLFYDTKQSFYNTGQFLTFTSMGVTLFTFILAIPFSLVAETPFMNIEKYVLFPAPRKMKEVNDSVLIAKSNNSRTYSKGKIEETAHMNSTENSELKQKLITPAKRVGRFESSGDSSP